MRITIGIIEVLIGLTYTGLGVLTVYELHTNHKSRGWSQFGLAFALMAFTCGPHHLLRAGAVFSSDDATVPASVVAALIVGLPPGLVFIALRTEAMLGGSGDRTLRRMPGLVPTYALVVAAASGAIVAAAAMSHAKVNPIFALSNALLVGSYLAIGWYILSTQFRRYSAHGTWSLSGIALGFIFPTCALIHAAHVFAGTQSGAHAHHVASDASFWENALTVLDTAGLPASIWFLIVVRSLYREGLADWNRRPIVGRALAPNRAAPWVRSL